MYIYVKDEFKDLALKAKGYFETLGKCSEVKILDFKEKRIENSAMGVSEAFEIFIPLEGLINIEEEKNRLSKELADLDFEIKRLEGKLGNEKFISKAPKEVVVGEKEKLDMYKEKYSIVKIRLDEI